MSERGKISKNREDYACLIVSLRYLKCNPYPSFDIAKEFTKHIGFGNATGHLTRPKLDSNGALATTMSSSSSFSSLHTSDAGGSCRLYQIILCLSRIMQLYDTNNLISKSTFDLARKRKKVS